MADRRKEAKDEKPIESTARAAEEAVINDVAPELTPLEKAQHEASEYKDLLLRLQADFENYKKRNKELSSRMYNTGISDAITRVFPVLDSLELALKMYEDKNREGVEQIIKQFLKIFESLGVKEIYADGTDFNPELHDAVMKCDALEEAEQGKVAEVFRKGYMFEDRVLRPCMVKVAN